MAISLNPIMSFGSTKLETKYQDASRYSVGASLPKATQITPFLVMSRSRMFVRKKRFVRCFSVANNDQIASSTSSKDFSNAENSPANDQLESMNNPPDETFQLQAKVDAKSESQTSESSNGAIDQKKQGSATSPQSQSETKRSSQALRERLKAGRVLSQYKDSKPSKPDMGRSRVLDALKESDKGKKRSRLPEAPSNLFDDSKRGLPKEGFTFQFPGGNDLFIIVFSFVFISTVMFATTYIVWKVGAIHFNEY